MAKHKRLRNVQKPRRSRATPRSQVTLSKVIKQSYTKPKATAAAQRTQHSNNIPFHAHDHILLIGEGDFSFSASLCNTHTSKLPAAQTLTLTATTLESHASLLQKHPQASKHIQSITPDYNASSPPPPPSQENNRNTTATTTTTKNTILYSIDATRLRKLKPVTRRAPYDRIVFNFPHVGGKSTDVNRQVRANQELIVSFLREAMALLRRRKRPHTKSDEEEDGGLDGGGKSERYDTPPASAAEEEEGGYGSDGSEEGGTAREPPSSIVVTIFEGEPYTLWNVRDLARHVGLRVARSFRFEAGVYPGYRHARTLGNLRGVGYDDEADGDIQKNGEPIERDAGEQSGKRRGKGAWRGEDRPARMYEFVINEEEDSSGNTKKKTKRDALDDSDEDT